MPRFELLRSAPFRLAMAFAIALTVCTILIFGFVYWQTVRLERERIGSYLTVEAVQASREPVGRLISILQIRLTSDLRRVSYGALFDGSGRRLIGNIVKRPPDLPADCRPRRLDLSPELTDLPASSRIMLVACRRADGGVVVLGKELDEVAALRAVILHAATLGLVPTVILALLVGAFLSSRALRRVRLLQQTIGRIMQGDLHERLPTHGRRDDLDQLASRINLMLDEIEGLIGEIRSIGDNIAHDLRTPLSAVRMKVEKAAAASDLTVAGEASRSALADLDKVFSIITALLRITEIENRCDADTAAPIDLASLVAEIFDLYEPLAEGKGLNFTALYGAPVWARADRHLLLEALANLVDNAIKFTPPGGSVRVAAVSEAALPILRVSDTGPGIPDTERSKVIKRFYRADKSRHIPGHGLGLSIVAAIARRHAFELRISQSKPGTIIDLVCQQSDAPLQVDIASQ
ncbi:HAMP domain-containing sensor histidine kinase [Dongia soli]|uniref:histidine kinase n=1 Tax=Dongia soli TaxID=600628 RepID=A0ABU5EIG8_9PROT|nr:HAMP domain-containing sensor histidine kinase [Dongia soli]MDY0885275.1 HAMP domain-containing sensor histidine kinase [Dongia soli]